MMEIGYSRIMLGSLVFSETGAASKARELHRRLIEAELKRPTASSIKLEDFDEKFVDLTTKTIQELWLGVEDPPPRFDFTFLYSLLYAPALYYHDHQEERRQWEIDAEWEAPNATVAAEHLKKVGKALVTIHDDRRQLRAWQIRSVALSFASVLPKDVLKAYEGVAASLAAPAAGAP